MPVDNELAVIVRVYVLVQVEQVNIFYFNLLSFNEPYHLYDPLFSQCLEPFVYLNKLL